MNFYFSLKVFEEKQQKKVNFQSKQQWYHQQTKKVKELKQKATLRYKYRALQMAEFHSVLRESNIYYGWNSN